jgi:hypothetical protein
MACITWQLPDGQTYLVAEGEAHRPPPGAINTGLVDWTCAGGTQRHEVDAMLEREGIQWGSAIKWVTQRMGIQQCSSCKAREEILNRAKAKGWAATLKELKDTF